MSISELRRMSPLSKCQESKIEYQISPEACPAALVVNRLTAIQGPVDVYLCYGSPSGATTIWSNIYARLFVSPSLCSERRC